MFLVEAKILYIKFIARNKSGYLIVILFQTLQ